MKHFYFRTFLIISTLFFNHSIVFAQLCDATVPVFPIDFTGHPDTTWTITNITRNGLCCTAGNPNRCIEFVITMDINQQGIALNSSGGPALGAGGIQVECDTTTYSFLDTICLSGIGPHHITLCKPGGNAYDYYITSIPKPNAGPPIAVSNGCTGIIYASGYIESSLVWTSVFPGITGAYNSYLSCMNGCDTTVVTAQPGYPDSVLYQVTGTPKGGCSAMTVTDSIWVFFVTDKTATILPTNAVVCAGTISAVLTATGTGGLPPYNYLWSTGQTTQSITVGVGTYWVEISDQTNCPTVFDTVSVTSAARPVADFNYTAACENGTTIFTDASTTTLGIMTGWNWDFGDGNSSTLQNPSHVYNTTGSYIVTLISSTGAGCADTVTKTITVTPLPVAAFVTNSPCYIDSVSFTDLSTISSGSITSWDWNFGDGNTGIQQNPSHYYLTAGNYNITLIATSALGCKDTTVISVNIQPSPNANFFYTAACVNAYTTFTDSSTIISGTLTSWSWDFGDGNTSALQNPTHVYTASGSYNVIMVVNSAAGCSDTITKIITVTPLPIAGFTTNSPCYRDSVSFTNTSTLSSGTFSSWNWDLGDGSTSTQQNPVHFYSTAGNYTISLIATSAGGCIDTASLLINIQPSPSAEFGYSSACSNTNIVFTDSSSIISGTLSGWSWDFGDGNSSTLQNPTHVYGTSGSYTVTLIINSAAGCSDTISHNIVITGSPVAGFTSNAPACINSTIMFTDASTITSGTITNWDWTFGDGNISSLQNPSYLYGTGGSYTVTLITTTAAGCKDTTVQIVNIQGLPFANAGNDTLSCANNPGLNLNGTIANAGGGIWSGSGIFSPGVTTLNPSYVPSAAAISNGSDTLLLTTTSNALCPAAIDTLIITITPSPTVNAGGNVAVCKDTINVPLCATVTVASGAMWQTLGTGTFVNPASACTQYIPSSADTAAGSVVVFVTSTGNGTCFSSSDTITITFTSTPTATITSNDTSCAGNPFNLNVIVTTGSGIWSTNGTGTFTPNNTTLNGVYNPSAADNAAGNIVFYFTSTNNGGCQSTHDTLNATLIPSPTGIFTSVPACPSFPVIFTDASTSAGSVVSWNWNFGDGNTSVIHNPTHVFNAGGPYNVTLIVASNNGCVDTVVNVVNVFNKPFAIYSVDGICLNEGVQFNDSSSVAGSTIASWNWNFGDAATSTVQNPLHYYSAGNTYPTSLIIHSAEGCIDTAAQVISVLTGPFAGFAADDVIADVDQTVHFSDQSTNGAVSWFWDFGDSSSDSTSTMQNPAHTYRIGGFYDVCLYATDINGCTDTICKQEIVTIPPSVPSGFTPNGDGQNDIFFVYGGPFKKLEFKIYNNWGELIFTSDKQSDGWDGKRKGIDQPIGVYVYTVIGITEDDKEHHLSGDVTLLR